MTIIRLTYVRLFLVAVLALQILLPGQSTFAQTPLPSANPGASGQQSVQMVYGELENDGTTSVEGLQIYAVSPDGVIVDVAKVDSQGRFTFRPLPTAHYRLQVADTEGRPLALTQNSQVDALPEPGHHGLHLQLAQQALTEQPSIEESVIVQPQIEHVAASATDAELEDPLPALLAIQAEQEAQRETQQLQSTEPSAASSEVETSPESTQPTDTAPSDSANVPTESNGTNSILLPEAQRPTNEVYLPLISQNTATDVAQGAEQPEAQTPETQNDDFAARSIHQVAAGDGVITGKVTDVVTGNGVANVSVSASEVDLNDYGSTSTNASGIYTIPNLVGGTYHVQFQPSFASNYVMEFYNNKRNNETADPVTVTDGQTTFNINPALETGGTVTGRVTDKAGNTLPVNCSVTLYDAATGNYAASTSTNSSGYYTMTKVMAGSYKVYFSPSGNEYIAEYYNHTPTKADATAITVNFGTPTSSINAKLDKGGVITGRVTDKASNAGIEGVSVSARESGYLDSGSDSTDASGYYTITGLIAGNYSVRFNNYADPDYLEEYYNDKHTSNEATLFAVSLNITTPNINAALEKGGKITGRVTDPVSGEGVASVSVYANGLDNNGSGSTTTDDSGRYTITSLLADNYRVHFSPPYNSDYLEEYYNNQRTQTDTDPVPVTLNNTTANIDAVLETGGKISGRVTNDSGAGVNNVYVYADSIATNDSGSAYTDVDGNYTIKKLAASTYRVSFAPFSNTEYLEEYYNNQRSSDTATPVTVTLNNTRSNINAQLETGGRIIGRVTNSSGAGLSNARVSASLITGSGGNSSYSDASGFYTITRLAAGSYKISFDPPYQTDYVGEYYNNQHSATASAPVTVTLNTTTPNINAQLETGGKITGRVTNSSGTGVQGVSVRADQVSQYNNNYASTDAAGYYTLTNLVADDYRILFDPSSISNQELVSEYYNDKHVQSQADLVAVSYNTTKANINAKLETGGRITGRVINTSGAGIANVAVRVNSTTNSNSDYEYTDAAGYYTFTRLFADSYQVSFTPPGSSDYVEEYYNNQHSAGGTTPVIVSFAQTTANINATMETGGKITGRVIDSKGAAVEGVSVTADGLSQSSNGSASTDANGYYTITRLVEDNYRIYFNPQYVANRELVAEYYNDQHNQYEGMPVVVRYNQAVPNINAQLETGGRITGRVINSSGTAMSGVLVYADAVSSSDYASTYSDAAGNYTITRLYAGDYMVQFTPPTESIYVGEYYSNQRTSSEADKITVAFNSTQSGINAQLELGGQIKGRVTNSAGAALAGVEVSASASTSFYDQRSGTTDASGNYTITGLITGTYYVLFSPTESDEYVGEYYQNQHRSNQATTIDVSLGSVTPGINATLENGGKITGRVTNASAAAFVDVTVEVYGAPDSVNRFMSAKTDSSGNYTITPLYTGLYYLKFVPPGNVYLSEYYDNQLELVTSKPVTAVLNSITRNINAQLAVGGQVTGKVTDAASQPIANVSVYAYSSLLDPTSDALATTDATGVYTLTPLSPGAKYIRFVPYYNQDYAREYYNNKRTRSTADPVNVTVNQQYLAADADNSENTVTGINTVLEENAGSIHGRITDTDGAAVKNVSVYAFASQVENSYEGYTLSDASGNYTITALSPGNYYLRFVSPDKLHAGEYYNDQPTQGTADPVAVNANAATDNINAVLQKLSYGSVTGQVTTSAGNPVSNGGVYLYASRSSSSYANVATDANGRYTVTNLAPGSYYPLFYPGSSTNQGYLSEYYNNKRALKDANPITVTANITLTNINGVLDLGGGIKGHVTDASGKGVEKVYVSLLRSRDEYSYDYAYTDKTGNYTITGLANGGYYLQFYAPSSVNLLDEFYNNQRLIAAAAPVTVTLGVTTTGIDAVLETGGSIQGVVTGADNNQPLAGVSVYAYGKDECNQQSYANSTITDASGRYTLTQLATGNYEVQFYPGGKGLQGYIYQYYNNKAGSPGDNVSVSAGSTTSAINAALQRGGQIAGLVTAADTGLPLPDLRVWFYRETAGKFDYYASALTDLDGTYSSNGLPAGNYKVEFDTAYRSYADGYLSEFYNDKAALGSATIVSVASGALVNNINGALARGGQIAGVVVDEVKLTAISSVYAYVYTTTVGSPSPVASGYTNNQGVYLTSALPAGTYYVKFQAPSSTSFMDGFYNGKGSLSQATPITVQAGTITNKIDAGLKQGAEIHGRVTSPDGSPVNGVNVTATDATGNQRSVYTSFNGDYSINGLPSGSYRVTFNGTSQSLRCNSISYSTIYYNQRTRFEDADVLTLVVPNLSNPTIQGAGADNTQAVPSVLNEINGVLPLIGDTPITPTPVPSSGSKIYLPVVQR